MFDDYLRDVKERVFHVIGIYVTCHPNYITLISLIFGLLGAWTAYLGYYWTSIDIIFSK
jgi:hypothetical protein